MTSLARRLRSPRLLDNTPLVIIILALPVGLYTVIRDWPAVGGLLALLVSTAGVVAVYRRPPAGLVLLAAAPLLAAVLGGDPISTWNIGVFAAFLLTVRGQRGLLTGVMIGGANLAAAGIAGGGVEVTRNPGAAIAGFAAVAAAAAGSAVRGQRQYRHELEERTRDALATRQAAVQRGVAEERLRIARDLHDSVGHQIAVVSMHLGSAEVHVSGDPDAARADLGAARVAVQTVLLETQQILQVLRVGSGDDPLAPTPSHERIPELVATFRAAGLTIEADLPRLSPDLPPEISAATFRITQEALTNAQRYGTGAVSLRIQVIDQAVVIEVVNVRAPAHERSSPGGGNGLVGMRERAVFAGGKLDVRADGGLFWVRAELPANRGVHS